MQKDMIVAYAAGFFDGEGCVNCSANKSGSPFVRIMVANTNIEVLELFKSYWGGDIQKSSRSKDHWKQAYNWRLANSDASTFLREILPFLVIKKDQASAAIQFNDMRPGKGAKWQEPAKTQAIELLNKIREKNKRGVVVCP